MFVQIIFVWSVPQAKAKLKHVEGLGKGEGFAGAEVYYRLKKAVSGAHSAFALSRIYRINMVNTVYNRWCGCKE